MKKIAIIGLTVATIACSVVAIAQTNNAATTSAAPAEIAIATETMGPTFPILEADAIETIQKKLQAMEKSGELERLKQQSIGRMESQFLEPKSISGITEVEKSGVRYFDPTFVLGEDIFDHEGNIIAIKGTRVNPLEIIPVRKKLFFFDGRSDSQVEMAVKLAKKYGNDFTPVLTAGSWVDTSEKLQQAVYFDQMGKMTTRLTVTSVPSLVVQEGLKMRIEEIKP